MLDTTPVGTSIASAVIRATRRLCSATASSSFDAVRIASSAHGKALVTTRAFSVKDVLFQFTGALRRRNAGMWSLMVGREAHLVAHEEDAPWQFLNHSFTPNVRLSHPAVASADGPAPLISVTAAIDLEPETPLTIDYTLSEWDMQSSFICSESGREVRGFMHLTEAEQDASLKFALPHIRSLYLQHLFGQSSRC